MIFVTNNTSRCDDNPLITNKNNFDNHNKTIIIKCTITDKKEISKVF